MQGPGSHDGGTTGMLRSIQTCLPLTRGPFHKAGSTTSESNPKRWVDLL